jgi:Spy/CpxP family protein refolding chaperone
MNRIRLITIATTLLALSPFAVPAATLPAGAAQEAQAARVPPVEPQMILLTEKLELSPVQQDKIKPILEELYDSTAKLVQDENMSRDERMNGIHAARLTADKKIRVVLSDEQKKKLDQVESEPHPELHGDVK